MNDPMARMPVAGAAGRTLFDSTTGDAATALWDAAGQRKSGRIITAAEIRPVLLEHIQEAVA